MVIEQPGLFPKLEPAAPKRIGRYERRVADASRTLKRRGELDVIDDIAIAGALAAARAADRAEADGGPKAAYAVAAAVRELRALYALLTDRASPQDMSDGGLGEALKMLGTPTAATPPAAE